MDVDDARSFSLVPWNQDHEEDQSGGQVGGIKCLPDRALNRDVRVLTNVLHAPAKLGKTQAIQDYFSNGTQNLVRPHMRKIVTEWMMELTSGEKSHPEVFALAVDYLDRILTRVPIKKNQFQLLATVCLFLASKFKENEPISAEKLVVLTDFSVTIDLITEWELMVLKVLNWDLSTVTPYTILNQLLTHHCLLNLPTSHTTVFKQHMAPTIRLRAETLIALAATETAYLTTPPTLTAVACLLAATSGVRHRWVESGDIVFRHLVDTLAFVSGHSVEQMLVSAANMEAMLIQSSGSLAALDPDFELTSRSGGSVPSPREHFLGLASSNNNRHHDDNSGKQLSTNSKIGIKSSSLVVTAVVKRSSSTPTDLMDVSTTCVC